MTEGEAEVQEMPVRGIEERSQLPERRSAMRAAW